MSLNFRTPFYLTEAFCTIRIRLNISNIYRILFNFVGGHIIKDVRYKTSRSPLTTLLAINSSRVIVLFLFKFVMNGFSLQLKWVIHGLLVYVLYACLKLSRNTSSEMPGSMWKIYHLGFLSLFLYYSRSTGHPKLLVDIHNC